MFQRVLQGLLAKRKWCPHLALGRLFLTQTYSYYYIDSSCRNCIMKKIRLILFLWFRVQIFQCNHMQHSIVSLQQLMLLASILNLISVFKIKGSYRSNSRHPFLAAPSAAPWSTVVAAQQSTDVNTQILNCKYLTCSTICKHLNITRSSVSNSVFWIGSALVILIKCKKMLIVMSDSYQ